MLVQTRLERLTLMVGPGHFTIADPVAGTLDGGNYLDLTVTYSQDTDLLIIPGPTISVSRSKRVWTSTA